MDYARQIMPLIQERARTLVEVAELIDFFFTDELNYEPRLLIVKKMNQELALRALETSEQRLEPVGKFDHESLETVLRPLAGELGLKTGQLFGTLRVAVTGRTVAPPLFETMSVLGKERCLERIRAAIDKLRQM
jgi:glutamyl-tRNA synthetase